MTKTSKPMPAKKVVDKLPKKLVGKIAEQNSHVASLRFAVVLLVLLNCSMLYFVSTVQRDLLVHIPPDLRSGAVMQANEIPSASVFNNTVYIWQAINTWTKSGEVDSFALVDRYSAFITPGFAQSLKDEYKKNQFDIRGRQRRMYLLPGSEYTDNRVIVKNRGQSWVVYLDVMVEESLEGTVVKQTPIRYPVIVERADFSKDTNPIALQLAGFYEPPRRIGG